MNAITFSCKFFLSIVCISTLYCSAPPPSQEVLKAAIAAGAVVPKLQLNKLQVKKCLRCQTNERKLQAYKPCEHHFCTLCVEEMERKECPICSTRNKCCAICFERFSTRKTIMLTCKHLFHKDCMKKVEQADPEKRCPICRLPISYPVKSRCEHCEKRLNNDSEIDGPICEITEWSWDYILGVPVPCLITRKVKHTVHDSCFNDFIRADVRINDEGGFMYRCLIHETWHPLSNYDLKKWGFKSIELHPSKIKQKKKEKQKPKKTEYEKARERCTGIYVKS